MVALVNDILRNSQLAHRAARRTVLWDLGAGIARWARRMRENHELVQLDERELRDIGLTRADVQMLLRKPVWRA